MQHPGVVIINPTAANGRVRKLWPSLSARLAVALGYDPDQWFTEAPGHAEQLGAQAAKTGYNWVGICGGDGTIHEVINGLCRVRYSESDTGNGPSVLILPCGTGNDFARSLNLPLAAGAGFGNWTQAAPRGRWIDVGQVGDRYFVNVAGVGFDAEVAATVNRERKWLPGAMPYVKAMFKNLVTYRNEYINIELDDERIVEQVLLVAIGIGSTYGGGMRILPEADPADGLLDVCIAGNLSKIATLTLLPRLFSGGHLQHPLVKSARAQRVKIEGPSHLHVHADGEVIGNLPVELSCIPKAIRIIYT